MLEDHCPQGRKLDGTCGSPGVKGGDMSKTDIDAIGEKDEYH